jgi:hypothetical protein
VLLRIRARHFFAVRVGVSGPGETAQISARARAPRLRTVDELDKTRPRRREAVPRQRGASTALYSSFYILISHAAAVTATSLSKPRISTPSKTYAASRNASGFGLDSLVWNP